jgi:sarcosine oxidase subunit gamma
VPDFTLTAAPPLAGTNLTIGDASLSAPGDLAIVSIALPLGGEDAARSAIQAAYGIALPEVGKSVTAGDAQLIRLASDQAFVLFTRPTPDAEPHVRDLLKGAAYTTDQTDVWCALDLSGAGAKRALERICPLDLHDAAFAVGDVARTVMEHLGVVILRSGAEEWRLLSASSSAEAFLHAVETSLRNVN